MRTIRRLIGLVILSAVAVLGLNAGQAGAATTGPFIPVQCQATAINANVSNLGVGYAFSARCNPTHPLVIRAVWYNSANAVIDDQNAWYGPGTAGVWSTYSSNLKRKLSPEQTSYVCIWVTQTVDSFLGGPLLTSGCFPRNS